jgi:hypothetical protein
VSSTQFAKVVQVLRQEPGISCWANAAELKFGSATVISLFNPYLFPARSLFIPCDNLASSEKKRLQMPMESRVNAAPVAQA